MLANYDLVNFLAHFYLAQPTAASRAGNFLGDFITGTPESLADELPSELLEGIMMHRKIDAYTDAHPSFITGKQLLSSDRKRFAGIILDMFTDHFLALHWDNYWEGEETLGDFAITVRDEMHAYWEFFPEKAKHQATQMIEGDWFQRYTTIEGLELSLTGLSLSRNRFDPIADSSDHLREHYDKYRGFCDQLLLDARKEFRLD